MQEVELISAASGSTLVITLAVVLLKDLIKSRSENKNGSSGATKSDITNLATKLSTDIKGVYDKLDGFQQKCFERHALLERELGENDKRIEAVESKGNNCDGGHK